MLVVIFGTIIVLIAFAASPPAGIFAIVGAVMLWTSLRSRRGKPGGGDAPDGAGRGG